MKDIVTCLKIPGKYSRLVFRLRYNHWRGGPGPLGFTPGQFKLQVAGPAGVFLEGNISESENGNRYVLVLGDYFTKWMETYPKPTRFQTRP